MPAELSAVPPEAAAVAPSGTESAPPTSVSTPPAGAPPAAGAGVPAGPQEAAPAAAPAAAPETAAATPESARPAQPEMENREPAATPPPVQEPGQAGAPGAQTSAYRVLEAARESYWLRDYATAEKQYNDLISMDPDNPDWYGELGNMYFSQGEWDKASAAYYEAGVRLVKQGMSTEAEQLVEVIRGLKGTQASDLEEKIKAASASTPAP